MKIQINTDKNVAAEAALLEQLEADVESTLARFSDQITRVQIHLGDENAEKSGGDDKRCLLEVRPAGQQPVSVTHRAATVAEACTGALRKIEARLESMYGRSEHRKGGPSIRHLPVAEKLT